MDKGERCEGEGEKQEANNPLVSSQVICDDIVKLLDYYERCKNKRDGTNLDKVERFELSLDKEDDSDLDKVERFKLSLDKEYDSDYSDLDEDDDADLDEEDDTDLDEKEIGQDDDADLDEEDGSDLDEDDDADLDEEDGSDLDEEDGSDLDEDYYDDVKTMLRLVQLSHLDDINSTMSRKSNEISSPEDATLVLDRLRDYIKSCLNSQNQSKSRAIMPEEKLVELLDSLVMILHDLSSAKSISPLMTQYRALQSVCSIVRDFHRLKVNGFIEPEIVEYYTPQFQLMAERIGDLCWGVLADTFIQNADSDVEVEPSEEVDLPQVGVMLAHLYVKIIHVHLEVMHVCFTKLKDSKSAEVGVFINQLLKASPDILGEYLMNLEDHMLNVTFASTSARKIHVMIELLLVILTDIPIDSIRHDKLFDLLVRVGAVSKEVEVLVHNIEDESSNEESTNKTNCTILHLLEDLKHVYLKAPDPTELCFNMSDGLLFMNLLLGHLNDLLNSNAYSVDLIKEEIGQVKEAMESIRSKSENVEQGLHKDIWKRVLDVAYEAKHVIDSILARDDGLLHLVFSLPNAMKKIKVIKEEVSDLCEMAPKKKGLLVVKSPKKLVKNMSSATSKIIVGFKEETDWIKRKLTSGPAELDVISIIGMPGIGKTTLAYKVYNDRSVISHFDIRAWCTVDQEYDRKMILHKILNQVTGSDEKLGEDIDVDDVLRRKLYGRRCLIVLDDLWDNATWDDLTRPFHQVKKGSRIILTSREKEVALHGKRHSDPLNLRLLRLEESWELLERRVFGEESCPVELLDVGKDIAKNCKGLPLVVDLIAGVIARREKEKSLLESFQEVLEDLNFLIFEDGPEVMSVIQLSYDHLSYHLKLCLLYLGSYKKDEEIKVNELKDLWSAEGFVEQIEMKSVEEVMEDYLDHLVSSSLLMAPKGKSGKRVCQIHDLVHDFCFIKARKEKLFDSTNSSSPSSFSSSSSSSLDLMTRQLIIHKHLPQSCKNIFLLDSEKKRDSSGKHILSLKMTGSWASNLMCHLRHLRLLRVLNLEGYDLPKYLLDEIGMLGHLRYLNTGNTTIEALPLSLSHLRNLETLVVDNGECLMALEPVIWNLSKLRHVKIYPGLFLGTALAEDSKLQNLRILKLLHLSYSEGGYDILKRFPNLQKLCCFLEDTWDSSAGFNRFPEFGFHNELEELGLYANSEDILSFEAEQPHDLPFFPLSLKSLKLGGGSVTSESLSTIASLPNLQELHLYSVFIQGKEWNMQEDDTFKNLKILELLSVEFSEWQVGEESFPVLEHLIFKDCEELKEIPSSFGDIDSLKCIELIESPQLEDSALQIKQYVEEMTGEDKLQVLVKEDPSE